MLGENKYIQARENMVKGQLVSRGIKNPKVIQAFKSVPRHKFVEEALWVQAYQDGSLPIGKGQTVSQPYTVALMIEALDLPPNAKVLEIGTGTGYQASILSRVAKEVYSIERIPSLITTARRIIGNLGYRNIELRVGDGTLGWAEHAPYDGIIVAAGSPGVPQELVNQLTENGRLIIPIGNQDSQALKLIYKENGKVVVSDLGNCRFVKLVGEYGWGKNC